MHNLGRHMAECARVGDFFLSDPGDAGAIDAHKYGFVNLVSGASGETRTLAAPTQSGLTLTLTLDTDGGGDITLTVASAVNPQGATVLVFSDAGDTAFLESFKLGSVFAWRLMSFVTAEKSVGFIPLSLNDLRIAAAMAVGNTVANGGLLSSNTAPILAPINGDTDGCQFLTWVATGVEEVLFQISLPPDLDTSKDIEIHYRIASGGTTDAVGFTLASYFNEGDTAVADTTGTNQTATYAEVIATIAAADIPTGAQILTVNHVPVAHTTDVMDLSGLWIEYVKKARTL